MSTTATPDTTTLEHLDFTPEVPCEVLPEWHDDYGTGPADYLIGQVCPKCGFTEHYATCAGCWDAITQYSGPCTCTYCRHTDHVLKFCKNLGPIH